ncbi:GNAT family N-acetyltransferase [Parafrankia sp. EUN1f]|uniref:GNAT family N-acetyltransferase n=1 Tax=Parafrankia sp. EUN1f TaxID=102897 RepID=UPI0007C463FC|nr:N-acetyltransferase [Parafrankia sp. EUN1f]
MVRSVRAEDLSGLEQIDQKIFGHLAYPYFVLRQYFDVHQSEILVAECEDRLIGYSIAVRSGADSQRDLAHFLALGVDIAQRGQGHGRTLAVETLRSLDRRGVKRVRLAVEPSNKPAITLYESLGFVRLRREQEYYGPNEPRFLYELMLAAAVYSRDRSSSAVPR